ncbi:MAG: saccharopine dehydrogenase NADP-binding domain-containing protein [Xanthomonadales bacterium]|nr:saccharopine dehydrogenase NADP-binding domain-containing protein [Xanthomonadales bacterium]
MSTDPRFDLVVYGATSFVGQILSRYLHERFPPGGALRWAIAGRSKSKLEALRDELGATPESLPLLLAEAHDDAALAQLCAQTRVVASTVGPYALYGESLVRQCAEAGTDYCDLTGEPQWIRRMLQAHEGAAQASGARIVHCCGFDSIPSDLGVLYLQDQARQRFGETCVGIQMRVKAMRGAASGGTVASLLQAVKEASANKALRRELANPYSLCSEDKHPKTRQRNIHGAQFDQGFDAWVAPFVMAPINTRIVQRTHALLGRPWGGESFRYDEASLMGKGLKGRLSASAFSAGLTAFMLGAALPPTRWALQRFVLPAPGEGPSPEAQARGFYDLRFLGQTASGQTIRCKVTGDRDPGYGSTAKILGEAAAMLALETPKGEPVGGFWTPATALGLPLIARLRERSGLSFEVLD